MSSDLVVELDGIRVYKVSELGPELRTGRDAVDIMSAASEDQAALFVPESNRGNDLWFVETFSALETRLAQSK